MNALRQWSVDFVLEEMDFQTALRGLGSAVERELKLPGYKISAVTPEIPGGLWGEINRELGYPVRHVKCHDAVTGKTYHRIDAFIDTGIEDPGFPYTEAV